ncbi:Gliding motility-associated ABC transporter ATP-binding protein GldA [Olavius algarvensis spirochete endosymbiont]|uniref:ABC transporter ATP-binding protein n=1 Tax=Olavius algarvensis spirochete endosymbiont TaxID=260710 RepID=UPI00052C339B|nr:ATP-binding cassette domain-containing protein [Olavius algarvensis spirochete endosymbiont]KGM43168.1 ABC transporter [Alkalispirochaeta odontotermitis]VDA99717.1 Gliding motility-associated ABC transporter ATP-binding protein GldA [Olavius algarvensis spirochete endosymbiont]
MIHAENLFRRFGRTDAVTGISFHIRKGAVVGFLGPNGAGKSTTMNLITGYLAPSSGSVFIDGIDIVKAPVQAKKLIGYLPEQPPLYRDLTVDEYLEFVSEFKRVPKSQRKSDIASIRDRVKIHDVRRRLIRGLSRGYKQRVGLAQALVGNPPVLILDEPTAGLDPKQIIEIRELIRSLGKERTVVISSHILPEISATCEWIIIINKGTIVASDTPENLSGRLSGSSGSIRQKLLIRGDTETIGKTFDKLSFLSVQSIKAAPEMGLSEVVIAPSNQQDVREAVFFAMAKAKIPILQMSPMDLNLEEIFLNLTTSED